MVPPWNRLPSSGLLPLPQNESPLAGLNQALPQIMYGNGNTMPRYRNTREGALVGAAIGAAIGLLIGRNWHRPWVRGMVSGIFSFVATWIATCIGACIVSAYVKPGDQADLGPNMLWTGAASLVIASLVALAFVRHTPQRSQHRLQ